MNVDAARYIDRSVGVAAHIDFPTVAANPALLRGREGRWC
jgi:hypothetical protein